MDACLLLLFVSALFTVLSQKIGWEERLRNDLLCVFCRVGRKTTTQNQFLLALSGVCLVYQLKLFIYTEFVTFLELTVWRAEISIFSPTTSTYSPAQYSTQRVTLTERNSTGQPCSVGCQAAHAHGSRPARPQRYRRRRTTDASEQNNTGPLGGPVITTRFVTYAVKLSFNLLDI